MSCGRNDDDGGQIPVRPNVPRKTCIRCRTEPPTIIVRNVVFCKTCFERSFNHKFKTGMEESVFWAKGKGKGTFVGRDGKERSRNGSVMVAFSGGPSSRAILDLVEKYTPNRLGSRSRSRADTEDDPKLDEPGTSKDGAMMNGEEASFFSHFFSDIEVVYIEDDLQPSKGPSHVGDIKAVIEEYGYKFISLSLSEALARPGFSDHEPDEPSPATNPHSSSTTTTPSLLSVLTSPPSTFPPTTLNSLRISLLHTYLPQLCISRGHSVLVLGDSADRLAVKTVSGMAQGRGWCLGEEVGFKRVVRGEGGDRDREVLVIRPFANVLSKEIAYFNRIKDLHSVFIPDPTTKTHGLDKKVGGIDGLVEDFVSSLQTSFPSTVSTIGRTAAKLDLRSDIAREKEVETPLCPYCGMPAQEDAGEWRRNITLSDPTTLVDTDPAVYDNDVQKQGGDDSVVYARLNPLLCYACLILFQDLQNSQRPKPQGGRNTHPNGDESTVSESLEFPGFVSERVRRRMEELRSRLDGVGEGPGGNGEDGLDPRDEDDPDGFGWNSKAKVVKSGGKEERAKEILKEFEI